jgi:hypothetical protein
LNNKAIVRFVADMAEPVIDAFPELFVNLEIGKVIDITFEIYGSYSSLMHVSTKRKCWNEILRVTLYQYIRSLLTSGSKKVKDKDDLLKRITSDKNAFLSSYEPHCGTHVTNETIKILNDFLDFLDCSSHTIGIGCVKIREYNGASFNLAMAKALINLRTDLDKTEKNEAIQACKEALEGFNSNNPTPSGGTNMFEFQDIEKEIEEDDQEGKDSSKVHSKKGNRRGTLNLLDFLNFEEKQPDADSQPMETDIDHRLDDLENIRVKVSNKRKTLTLDTDVVIQGMIEKKSHSKYQPRFAQLKNGFIYWYLDKTSREAQNSIDLKLISNIETEKADKFTIVCGEKVYKFWVHDQTETAQQWIDAIKNEIKKHKEENSLNTKKIELEIGLKKKVIVDYYKLPDIHGERKLLKRKIEEHMRTEMYFPEKRIL